MADPFRKRRKKSKKSRSKLSHFDQENGLSEGTSSSTTSLSFQFEAHNLNDDGARTNRKKKRKMRKSRLKAFQRNIDRSSNDGDGPTKLHSNVGVYTADYLQSLKAQNKAMSASKPPVDRNVNVEEEGLDQNVMDLVSSDSDSENEEMERQKDIEHDELMRAKILTSKLQRRTKALANAIDEHTENTKKKTTNIRTKVSKSRKGIPLSRFGLHIGKRKGTLMDEDEHDLQEDDQYHQFMPLGKFQTQKQEMQQMMDQNTRNRVDLTVDDNADEDHFEAQQIQKSGIIIDAMTSSNVITIDDDDNDNDRDHDMGLKSLNARKSSAWNRWNEDEDGLTLDAVNALIDGEINGSQNVVRPPMGSYHVSYEQFEGEYRDIGHQIEINKKQSQSLETKRDFFQKLNNEVTAYLNCISEKRELIEKYLMMEVDLSRNRHQMREQWHCLNHLESFQESFYPQDFTKDLNAADALQKLSDLNSSLHQKTDDSSTENAESTTNQKVNIFKMDENGEFIAWNPKNQSLNRRRYLLHKKRRHESRKKYQRNTRRKLNDDTKKKIKIKININGYDPIDDAAEILEAPSVGDTAMNSKFSGIRDQILDEMKSIFNDTRPQYRSFEAMKKVLEEWKRKYPKDYEDAFVSISAPKLIAPFIRMQLMEWNPLKYTIRCDADQDPDGDSRSERDILSPPQLFVHCKWYRLMAEYGTNEEGTMKEGDPDDQIVPTLVASLVIPRLITVVETEWNPYSKRQSQQLRVQMQCALEHIDGIDAFIPKMDALYHAIKRRGDEVMANLISIECLPQMFRSAIFSKFKKFAVTPLDGNNNGGHGSEDDDSSMALPGGDRYEFIRNRVLRALMVMDNLSKVLREQDVEGMISTLYASVIQGFMTYLARCPSRNALNSMDAQEMVLSDFCDILHGITAVIESATSSKSNDHDEDDDVQMNDSTTTQSLQILPQSVVKHLKLSISELDSHLSADIKAKNCDKLLFLKSFTSNYC